ncbi:hypothetical protein [Umezawaea beigongshangensis]|uniref:hypothetical protein n=1 Tax=Umezawaea beigongshangensis TaxID=2780383 RepID=UPI0018F12B0F|nr:hypothetical protein [Umezawaea beigongshangensis]
MTPPSVGDRRRFAAAVADAAGAVAAVLGANPLRGSGPYPIAEVLPVLVEQHESLRAAVDGWPGPLAVDAAGREDPLVVELAGLMSCLQLLRVLHHGLDGVPAPLRVTASRHLATTHLVARRVRDRARRAS